jgi:integrase
MKDLLNGCSRSEIWVNPRNWKTISAKSALAKNWYVQCKFFDPAFQDIYPNGFPFRTKVNKGNPTLELRKAAIQFAITEMQTILDDEGFNPITKTLMLKKYEPEPNQKPVRLEYNRETPLRYAIEKAFELTHLEAHTLKDIKSVKNYFLAAAEKLDFDMLPVNDLLPMNLEEILAAVRTKRTLKAVEQPLTEKRYNKYIAYLSGLFRILKKNKMVDSNPCEGFEKKHVIVAQRKILTPEQRKQVYYFLKMNYPSFWLFYMIFFHSGGRLEELLRLKVEDVCIDPNDLKYTTLVKKGGGHRMIDRPIKKIALQYWAKAIIGAEKGDYVFSIGLVPGQHKIRRDQTTRRWKSHIKEKLGIEVDLYAGKHMNLTEIVEWIDEDAAAKAAGHTSTRMVKDNYDVNNHARNMDKVRNMRNHFIEPEDHIYVNEFCNTPSFLLIRPKYQTDMARYSEQKLYEDMKRNPHKYEHYVKTDDVS